MKERITTISQYQQAYTNAYEDAEKFWGEWAQNFTWKKPWSKVSSGDFHNLDIKWFEGGELNITENCLDRHLEKRGNKTALLFEPNDPTEKVQTYTYQELYEEVNKVASSMKKLGVQKGDRVVFYMSQVPELLMGVLACARVGAIHSVVFAGFSAQSLADRVNDCEAKWVFTNDHGLRGNKTIALKEITDEAMKSCDCVEKVVVFERSKQKVNITSRDIFWSEFIAGAKADFPAETMQAEDPLFILYTSGSTGKPKGLLHTTAGYMCYAAYSFQNVFQVEENDIYWCTADIGWITGHTYLTYGPLLSGATTVMFEGVPTYPAADRFWEICDKHKVTHFYTAPTAIRALMACGDEHVEKHKLETLKVLGSVGEPINQEAWDWYNQKVGKKDIPIVDTWWQTETGGIMISSLAGVTPMKACHATLPLPGIQPVLVDEKGTVKEGDPQEGHLCIAKPWPSMARTIYGDHERYKQTYFSTYPGYYFTGDGCKRDEEGHYRITGRVDDVINVSGHRLGTAEIENAINEHQDVVESAVVGYPHDIKGQGIFAYIITEKPVNDKERVEDEILKEVTKGIGPIAKPDKMLFVEGLPKTRSGKIMRRILRKIAADDHNFGDTSTLLDPSIVDKILASK